MNVNRELDLLRETRAANEYLAPLHALRCQIGVQWSDTDVRRDRERAIILWNNCAFSEPFYLAQVRPSSLPPPLQLIIWIRGDLSGPTIHSLFLPSYICPSHDCSPRCVKLDPQLIS